MLTSDEEATSEWVVYEGLLQMVTFEWDMKDKESAMRKSGKSILNTENTAGAKAFSGDKAGRRGTSPG